MVNNLSKIIISLLIFSFAISVFIFTPKVSLAANSSPELRYELLAPLPNFCDSNSGQCAYTPSNFNGFLNAFIRLTITLAAILAVAAIVYGGFEYMTSESLDLKSSGRSKIQNAIIGLILLTASFLILNTINPNILNFNLDIKGVNVSPPSETQKAPTYRPETVQVQKADTSASGIIEKSIPNDQSCASSITESGATYVFEKITTGAADRASGTKICRYIQTN